MSNTSSYPQEYGGELELTMPPWFAVGMTVAEALSFLATRGLEVAHHVREDGAADLGLDPVEERLYKAIGESYFGPCSEKPTRALVVELAAEFSIARLAVIHQAAGQLNRKAPISRWDLRLELARLTALSIEELRQHARARVRELNSVGGSRPPRSVVISRHPDATGRRTAVFKLPEDEMAALERRLRDMTRARGTVPEDIAMGNAMWALLTTGQAAAASALEPTVLVKAEDLVGAGEDWLQATDGTRVHAREYLNGQLGRFGWVLLYDGNAEPVNLYRIKRLANDKQRRIIAADQGQCAWPGCPRIALYGRAHHVKAWSEGGETNLNNLVGLCGQHNALNDDDPNAPPRNGRIERDEQGRPVLLPPDGGKPRANEGFHTRQSGRVWALGAGDVADV